MSSNILTGLIIGVFIAETVKNIAKGSANIAYENFHLFFDSEIISLGLGDGATAEEVSRQLEARPDVLEKFQRKLTAQPKLAEDIKKVIEEQTGQNLTTINVISHNQTGGQTAHTIINNNSLPTLPITKVNVDIEHILEEAFDEQETYRLIISLANLGDKPISNYRFDVEFPRAYLNDSTGINFEREDKITATHRYFRIIPQNQNNPLYPGDKRAIFSPNYYVRGFVPYSDTLKITVYIDELLSRTIEKPIKELVNL